MLQADAFHPVDVRTITQQLQLIDVAGVHPDVEGRAVHRGPAGDVARIEAGVGALLGVVVLGLGAGRPAAAEDQKPHQGRARPDR